MASVRSNFLDLSPPLCNFDTAKVSILCLPYESSTTYGKGTVAGPEAIVAASTQVELYDEELAVDTSAIGITTVRPDAPFPQQPEAAVADIADACARLLTKNKFVVGLGGEHTVTVGMVRAFTAAYPGMSVLQLDAHSDLRDSYQGSAFNHACVMARVAEMCPYVGIGVRSGIAGERALLSPRSRLLYAHEMQGNSDWQQEVIAQLGEQVYVTIDLDFFDPSVVPSVGTPEPGGFAWYETLAFLRKVTGARTVVGFDVVELLPKADFPASDFLAAKLIYRLLGYIWQGGADKKKLDY